MTVVCSWCLKVIRLGDPDLPASHGICPDCAAKFETEVAA